MQNIHLFRKVASPALPSIFLHRSRLISILREAIVCDTRRNSSRAARKLVFLCAPAGYGKTTLLADFATSQAFPCCWYFLKQADTDVMVFLHTLLASIRQSFPQFGKLLASALTNAFRKGGPLSSDIYKPAIDALCNAIAAEIPEQFALFLCNYEYINEHKTLTDLMNYLLAKLPPQAVLVIESRAFPHLDLTSLLMRDEVFSLNQDALRFSPQEIADLAKLHGLTSITLAHAEQLAISFDGWIAGILLGTYLGDFRLLPPAHGPSLLKTKSTADPSRSHLFAYVAREVFQREPAMHEFLQPASILHYMEGEMCNILLGTSNAHELLARLERQGLFVSCYENTTETVYTCHPVVRDLLTAQLRQDDPERFRTLHRQAAKLWLARQNYDQAMHHALEAGASDQAVQVILNAYRQFLQQGRLDTLSNWLQMLSPSVRENLPRLMLIEAYIHIAHSQYALAFPLLDKISALIACASAHANEAEILLLQSETDIARSRALCLAGDYDQALALCRRALQQLPDQEIEMRAAARIRMGICAHLQGDFSSGILHLREALLYWDNRPPAHQAADIHGALVTTYYLTGNLTLADYHLTRSLSYCEQLQDDQGKIDNLLRKGIISKDQGRYVEAETVFQEAREMARNSVFSQHREAYALANLSELSLDQGQYRLALAFCEDALAQTHRGKDYGLMCAIFTNMSLAHLLLGDTVSAQFFLDKIDFPAVDGHAMSYEQACREFVHGLILFYQERYDEARSYLTKLESILSTTHLQRECLQVQVLLAACLLALKQETEAIRLLENVTLALTNHKHYQQRLRVELHWLTALLQIVKHHPRLARLRELLALETEMTQEAKERTVDVGTVKAPVLAPHLTIRAFGEPAVLCADQPVQNWRMARGMELFFFLLDADCPLSKERIITEIWSDFDEQTNQTFHSTIHHLRKLFGASCLIFQAGRYSLNLAAHYGTQVWYDVQAFQAHRVEAEQALTHADDAAAREALLQMVELYRGDYGRPFYSNWCTARRDDLRVAYLEARRQLAQIAWRDDAFEESIEHWRQVLQIDDCLEEAHLGLMRCYSRQGKRSLALRQYRDCQEILQQELGIEPEPAIQQLYQSLTSSSTPLIEKPGGFHTR